MNKPNYTVNKVTKKKTEDGKEIQILSLKTNFVNAPCKSCGIKQRKNGSSRCSLCSAISKKVTKK